MSQVIEFRELPGSIIKHYGDGSTVHQVIAWDDDRGARFKVILSDGTFSNWAYSRTIGWHISIW